MSLTVRYVLAFIAIGITCIASQLLIHSMLAKAEAQARIVDTAGRQRMLSQRIAKVTSRIPYSLDDTKLPDLLADLAISARTLRSVHQTLAYDDQSSETMQLESAKARVQLLSVDPSLKVIVSAAVEICDLAASDKLTSNQAIRLAAEIEKVENDFVAGMNQVVRLIADHSLAQINRLFWAERAIMSTTLVLLLLEAIFVFRPAVRRARESIQGLRIALAQARSANESAEIASSDRSTALSAAAIELKRLSAEIASLECDSPPIESLPQGERFNLLFTHVQNTLVKLTDLADRTNQDEVPLLVSRTSPRTVVKDAVIRFRAQIPKDSHVNVTMDDRLPATLLVDERVFRDSIVHLLQSVFNSTGPNVSVHVGYDDREFRLSVGVLGQGADMGIAPQACLSPDVAEPQLRCVELDSLDLLLAKREIERLGGTIDSSKVSEGITILMPLDETKQMNLFLDSDRLQIA